MSEVASDTAQAPPGPPPLEAAQGLRGVRTYLFSVVLAVAFLAVLLGYFLSESHRQALAETETTTRNLVQVIESRLHGDLDRASGILDFVAGEFSAVALSSLPARDKALHAAHLPSLLRRFPSVAQINVFDTAGDLQLSSNPDTPSFNIADLPSFKPLRDDPQAGLIFSDAQISRSTGHRALVISRALRDRKDRFIGVVAAVINLDEYVSMFGDLDVGPQGISLIRRSDNSQLVLRQPPGADKNFTQPLPRDNPIRQRIEAGEKSGTLWLVASTDGVSRLASFQKLEDYPFYVQVAQAEAHYLAAWHTQARMAGVASLVFALLMAYSLHRVLRNAAGNRLLLRQLRQNNETLAVSEARQRALFEHAHIPILLIDPQDGAIIDANQAAENFYGYRRQTLRQMPISDINQWAPEQIQAEMSLARLEQRDSFHFPHRLASGEIRQVEVHSGPLEVGGRILLYSFIQDITARKAAELALATETARLRALLQTASDGIHILDSSGHLVECSHSFATMLGYSDAETAGLHVSDWDTQFPLEQLREVVLNLIEHPASLETRHRCKDGSAIEVEVNAKGIEIAGVTYLYASSRDITTRKHQEEELVAQRRRLKDILEGTNVGTWEWNIQTGEVFFNERWANIVGYSLDELSPITIDTWHSLGHPDDINLSGELLNKHFAGELPYYECTTRMRHKAGNWVWVLDRGRVSQRSSDGKPLQMSGTHQDISAQKQYEATLEEARREADAANQAKSRFLTTMSHEIRTPMNGILGMAQLLLTPQLQDVDRRDYARTILNSGETLLTLLNDILDFSKIEAGKYELESSPLEPQQLLRETQALFLATASRKGLSLESEWNGPQQRYLGDPHRLRQMLANLVGNAIKFTAHGRIRIACREIERAGPAEGTATLEFSVTDSGIGLAADKLPLLFQPFTQADSSTTRQFGGSGLGLSIIKSLADLMGGEVGADSTPGQGSRFWFRIRAEAVAAGADSRQAGRPGAAEDAREGVLPRFEGRVLVTESNPASQRVIAALLKMLGLTCEVVEDGQQCIAAHTGGAPADLILMDLQMPVMNGCTATARIRAWEQENHQVRRPIIALTADVYADDRAHCLACGMDDFLAKPVDFELLTAMLGRWLPALPIAPGDAAAGPRTQLLPDGPRIAAVLAEIMPLLELQKFSAIKRFQELQSLVEGTAVADEIADTSQLLAEFQFDLALERLRRIAATQGWEDKR
jgi:PAS domain S-box-containing protein